MNISFDLLFGEGSRVTNQFAFGFDLFFVLLEEKPGLQSVHQMETELLIILKRAVKEKGNASLEGTNIDFIGTFLLTRFELHEHILH